MIVFLIALFYVRNVDHFSGYEGGEYSLVQYQLHSEFCALFESFCEKFIRDRGFTMEQFYDIVRQQLPRCGTSVRAQDAKVLHASEVIETISLVADFEVWAARLCTMASERKSRLKHISNAPLLRKL